MQTTGGEERRFQPASGFSPTRDAAEAATPGRIASPDVVGT
jgi:hypothetical protein